MAGQARISFEATPGFRDVRGRFVKANREMLDDWREAMRDEGRRAVRFTKDEAPEGKTGKFKKGIRFRTFQRTKTIMGFTISMPQPLGTFITEGTKRHKIAARRAKALVFFWPKVGMVTVVPKGGGFNTHVRDGTYWVGKGYVDHPGTKKNPFHIRAKKRWYPHLAKKMKRTVLRYSSTATKK